MWTNILGLVAIKLGCGFKIPCEFMYRNIYLYMHMSDALQQLIMLGIFIWLDKIL